ncbi:formate dehydrogenase accessory sulfurtransferase FdhD [Marinobacterium sp. D7]|uniref:formate dehydrogenase accessory sulfurtransferase FdhD n=1 Tax=Marinobacterium ramblicola TaxID=2849041 RepID=UPI001C2D4030|nr:formate dehydrogenase accessory sulfurtransferase FdhD [Marinobacterium ramblicola]MBV1790442.1 formate dehydrogenase accessory sulfurtransferase FdhD [Marinobacterium ramblicola]
MSGHEGRKVFNVQRRQGSASQVAQDQLAEEVAVALVYNGLSHVVMMASPTALEDFALGFSLSEGIIQRPEQLYGIDIEQRPLGIELLIEIATECFAKLKEHRRNLTGRTGCGLCGAESLQQAVGTPKPVRVVALPDSQAVENALGQLKANQPLQSVTGAVHGAALCDLDGHILLLREDVGRHNALDKLIGARAACREKYPANHESFVLISSRASYEMVNKCNAAGISTLVAVSAPTALAVEHATAAGMNLIGFARPGRHVIYAGGQSAQQESRLVRTEHVSD